MAKECIEREAAIKSTCENCTEQNICGGSCDDTDRLRAIPTADVVSRDCYDRLLAENDELRKSPVRHGRWEKKQYAINWSCSLCGNEPFHCNLEHMNYCPNCGARMDGGRRMRLTKRDGNKVWFAHGRQRGFFCPREFCDNAYGCDKVKDRTCPYLRLLDKLAAYEDAEEQGLLVRLPCKVGDTFYYIAGTLRGNEYVASDTVAAIEISDTEPWIIDSCGCHHIEFWMTREDAEAALKGETGDV